MFLANPAMSQEFSEEFHKILKKAANHCVCVDYNCGCCAHIVEKQIHLDNTSMWQILE